MPLASPNSVSASCIAPASFSESSTPNTVTAPALPGPGADGSGSVDAAVASVSPRRAVRGGPFRATRPSVVPAVVSPPAVGSVATESPPASSSSSDVLHAAATRASAIGTADSRTQLLLIRFPLVDGGPGARFL